MKNNWKIVLYESGAQTPVEDFIRSLQVFTLAKLMRQFDLLEEFGSVLGMPHVKRMGGGLYELRVRGKQEIRVFYVFAKVRTIIVLHGFVKKTQATPPKELLVARRRQSEVNRLV